MFNISDYNFDLPKELIAQEPISDKANTKMIVYDCNDQISHHNFINIANYINQGDVIILNDVKVIKAKLTGNINNSLQKLEINLDQEINSQNNNVIWQALCKPAKKIKSGDIIHFASNFKGTITEKLDDGFINLEFPYDRAIFFAKIDKYGTVPLPPYIKRAQQNISDQQDYQTIYAKNGSAVAAPTAGLHFNQDILSSISNKGALIAKITLNVGAGTFLPVRCNKITDHKMHKEYYQISQESASLINNAKKNNKKIIAVGTTTLRAIESATSNDNEVTAKAGYTDIFIYPSYKFKMIDMLLTNFHLPKSTLFILISAFIGKDNAHKLYNIAIKNNYRFYSYGDCSLLFKRI